MTAVTDLAERIAAHLDAALIHHERSGFGTPIGSEQRGLAVGGPFAPRIVLTVHEVARLAAQAARDVPPDATSGAADQWAERLASCRKRLTDERDRLGEQIDQAEARFDAVGAEHRDEIEALAARIPELSESPTELAYLTWRAAQADRDLALVRYEVALTEAAVAVRELFAQQSQTDLRIGQVDHLTGEDPYGVGGDEQLAILTVDLEGANLDAFAAARTVELAHKRLAAMTAMRDKIHANLRDLERQPRTA